MLEVNDEFILVQYVKPAKQYKLEKDGSISAYCRRTMALERLFGYLIKSRIKIKFVVTKRPLPGIPNPSKSGIPIDYMYPVDLLKDYSEIDFEWYKKYKKMRIGDKMSNVINIEICKSPNKEGTWNMRIGDIEGAMNVYNMAKKDIIDLISEEIKHLDNLKVAFKPVYTDGEVKYGHRDNIK